LNHSAKVFVFKHSNDARKQGLLSLPNWKKSASLKALDTTHVKLAINDYSRMRRVWSLNRKNRGKVFRTYFVFWVELLQR